MVLLMSEVKCLVCGSSQLKSSLEGLVECKMCGFISADLSVSDYDLKMLYDSGYFNGEEYVDYLSDKQIIQKNFRARLNKLQKYTGLLDNKTLFEVGCAYGFFLEITQKLLNRCSGIDISDDAVKYAHEILGIKNVMAGDFLDVEISQKYDIFCLWDTIEHLRDPDLYIRKIYECTNKDGYIAITTGDIGSLNAKVRRNKWRQIHPPTHLHYFSENTLKKMLINNGYDIVYCGHPGSLMSMNNILYGVLVIKKNYPMLYKILKIMQVHRLSVYVNLFDYLYVIGRKK